MFLSAAALLGPAGPISMLRTIIGADLSRRTVGHTLTKSELGPRTCNVASRTRSSKVQRPHPVRQRVAQQDGIPGLIRVNQGAVHQEKDISPGETHPVGVSRLQTRPSREARPMSHMCPKVLASLALAFALLNFFDAPAAAGLSSGWTLSEAGCCFP